jgi:hypothetical protein
MTDGRAGRIAMRGGAERAVDRRLPGRVFRMRIGRHLVGSLRRRNRFAQF